MIGTFPGKLALVEGDEVDVDLEIAGGRLRLTTGVSEIGAWPLGACLVTALPTGAYELTLDGERVAFAPDHPDAFAAVVARMSPAEPVTPAAGFDLEAALDQVLGGNANYEVPGLVEESAAEIAVTLEALFATAYPDYDLDAELDVELDGEVTTPGFVESTSAETISPVADESVPDSTPSFDADAAPLAAPGSHGRDTRSELTKDPLEPHTGTSGVEPVVDVSGWVGEDHDVPVWSPAAAAEHGVVTDPVGIDPLPVDRAELGARWRPGAVDADEPTDIHETNDHVPDAAVTGVGYDRSGGTLYRADEPEDAGLPGSWQESAVRNGTGAVHDPVEPSLDEVDDEIDDEIDEEMDRGDGLGGGGGHRPPGGTGGGFGRGGHAAREDRSAPRSPDFDDGLPPDRGFLGGSEFDLDRAAASAGYSMPGDEMEDVVERVPARRGMGGIFSRSAGERLSAVAGAMRDQPDDDEDDDTVSVADQILASQEQLRSGSKLVRFTPALVKKVAIGLTIVTIVAGFVLITPTVIGYLVDRVQSEAEIASPTTSVPGNGDTVASVPTTTVPVNQTTSGAIEVVDARPVFELDSAEFVDRWNDTGSRVTESLAVDDAPGVGPFGLGFTRYLGLEGIVGDSGLIESYTVVVDPLGDPTDDQLGIQAFGVAINVAEPEATGPELSSILLDMGLDVGNPVVEGLGGSTYRNGVTYALEYDATRQLIRLTVTPGDGAQPDTSTP